MDMFGIGTAMRGMVTVYMQMARRTGRTASMIESVKDGDRLVFIDPKESMRAHRLCVERGVNVECIVIPIHDPGRIFQRGTSHGRTLFDHRWVAEFYREAIERCARDIDDLEKQASGFGAAHRETKRQAIEASRWESL